jgi:hypothetical protein
MSLNKYDLNHKHIYLLLGPQEVGKTCFLSGMYYAFRSSLNGFSLSCSNEEQGVALNKMCNDLCNGTFPSGTGGTTKFNFQLRYAHEERFTFEWCDYRGKMLEEGGIKDEGAYAELVNIVNNSTCILICVDATWLSKDKNDSVKAIQDHSYAVNGFLDRYIDKNGKFPPICVVITKFDLCDPVYEAGYYDAIKESFPFFENTNIPIYICPICIGKKEESTQKFVFNPTDQDVYRPLFFALWCGYGYKIAGIQKNLLEEKEKLQPIISELQEDVKKLNDRKVCINRKKRIASKEGDLRKVNLFIKNKEQNIERLKKEQKVLLKNISAAKNILWGNEPTTWEEVSEKWKFIQ